MEARNSQRKYNMCFFIPFFSPYKYAFGYCCRDKHLIQGSYKTSILQLNLFLLFLPFIVWAEFKESLK